MAERRALDLKTMQEETAELAKEEEELKASPLIASQEKEEPTSIQ